MMDNKINITPDNDVEIKLAQLPDEILGTFLNQQEINLLLKFSQIASYKSGETILQQSELIDGVYIILEGNVLVNAIIMGQGITRLETLFPGQFLGAISFIDKCPCLTSFVATKSVLCLYIPDSYFQRLSYAYPETKHKIFEVIVGQICDRLKIAHDIVTSFISESEMTSLSFFDRVAYSLNQPKKINFEDTGINKERLRNSHVFNSFTKEEFNELLAHFVTYDAPKNCKLINEGDNSAACYLVLFGGIQSCIIHDAKLAKLSVIGPGTLLASIGCVDTDANFNITYITCEQSILFKLPVSTLQLIKESQPELWYKLYELICGSLTALKKSVDKLNIRLHTETYNR